MSVLAAVTVATAEPRKQLFNRGTAVVSRRGSVANLVVLVVSFVFFFFFFFCLPSPPRRRSGIARRLSLAGERRAALRGRAVARGGECLFISLFLALPEVADPLETVHGLWFGSVCARLSYLIKYLQPLMGPSRSRPAGETPRRRPCMASRRRCEDASARERRKEARKPT